MHVVCPVQTPPPHCHQSKLSALPKQWVQELSLSSVTGNLELPVSMDGPSCPFLGQNGHVLLPIWIYHGSPIQPAAPQCVCIDALHDCPSTWHIDVPGLCWFRTRLPESYSCTRQSEILHTMDIPCDSSGTGLPPHHELVRYDCCCVSPGLAPDPARVAIVSLQLMTFLVATPVHLLLSLRSTAWSQP